MSTIDEAPSLPYYSAELRRLIGIPDHPAIHLAIATLADRLMAVAATVQSDPELRRINAVRAASAAALFSWPIEWAENDIRGDGPPRPYEVWWSDEQFGAKQTDWIELANERLRHEGIDTEPDARRMKTKYGWDERALIPGESFGEQREAYLRMRAA